MTITIDLPDAIEGILAAAWREELPRKVLEAIAAEGYRQEVLTHGQAGDLLGLSRWETDAFLKERGAYLNLLQCSAVIE